MPRESRTEGYNLRLAEALERGPQPMSIRELGRRVEEAYPDLRGATYGGVRQYVQGNIQNPRVELLRAIADILGIRADWLAFDEGAMTETSEKARRAVESGAQDWQPFADRVLSEVEKGLVRGGVMKRSAELLLAAGTIRRLHVLNTWSRLTLTERGQRLFLEAAKEAAGGRRDVPGLGVRLGEALAAPLRALDVDPASLPSTALDDYVATATAALRHLCPEPAKPARSIRMTTEKETDDAEA